ncbi:TetR/AcrR family transcriptional regulator [Actinomadura rugatobispora]|uniref:TetR/AcrR family transcriptional regulator n=1 Tax=Actinomadura rugatobispora TaxID=1994 RepID=A0ABW0ZT61_9ACTN
MSDSKQPGAGPGLRAGQGRGRGRPPKIDRAAIARAAGEIPLNDLTLGKVAQRLGVSVPSLYHYVRGRDDLLRLAAAQSATRLTLPVDHDQHWAVWFYEWAVYIREAFVDDPGLLTQYINGAINIEVLAEHVDGALGLCVRQGFSPAEAMQAYDLVSECALGAAVTFLRQEAHPIEQDLSGALAEKDVPYLRLAVSAGPSVPLPFTEQIVTVLAGIATRRGEDWTEISELLANLPGASAT